MHIGFTNLAQYGALKTYQGTLDAMSTMPVEQVQRIPYRDDGSQRQLRHDTRSLDISDRFGVLRLWVLNL